MERGITTITVQLLKQELPDLAENKIRKMILRLVKSGFFIVQIDGVSYITRSKSFFTYHAKKSITMLFACK